ncbi:MAG TPA: hypothetical protein VG842_10520 [Sediminibacterium sp.]|nr:hypothetical protein [Sediminibacterium sp.]
MEPDQSFTPQQSLDLIRNMIQATRGTVADNSFYFLLWGWMVAICCMVAYFLKVVIHYPQHYLVWWLMPVGGIVSWIYGARQEKKKRSKSFTDEMLDYVWIAIAISFIVLVLINMFGGTWQTATTYYILLYAIGTYITGRILRFRPLVWGGLLNFVLAVISARLNYDQQLLMGAFAIATSYILPGHLLRARFQKEKQEAYA